jgi:hypothetical protein
MEYERGRRQTGRILDLVSFWCTNEGEFLSTEQPEVRAVISTK